MKRFFIYAAIFTISTIGVFLWGSDVNENLYSRILLDSALALITMAAGAMIDYVIEHSKSILLSLRCHLLKRNERIYISMSYLFRIKLRGKNKYLMVRGNKIKNQYQPVGGVYKKFPSLQANWQNWGALESKNDRKNADDLRFEAKRKHIPEIRSWFYERKNREIDVWREFFEELIESQILPQEDFKHIKPEYLYSKEERLILRKGKTKRQFLIHDIYRLNLTEEQDQALFDLHEKSCVTTDYAFVDEQDLDKELFNHGTMEHQLGYHARFIKSES